MWSIIKQIIVPFLGRGVARHLSAGLSEIARRGTAIVPVLVTAFFGGILSLNIVRVRTVASIWLFVTASVCSGVAYSGAISGGPLLLIIGNGGRYSFLPVVLSGLAILALAARDPMQGRSLASRAGPGVARAAVVLVGVRDIFERDDIFAHGPDWSAEVAKWRADPAHAIAQWPDGWFLRLGPPA